MEAGLAGSLRGRNHSLVLSFNFVFGVITCVASGKEIAVIPARRLIVICDDKAKCEHDPHEALCTLFAKRQIQVIAGSVVMIVKERIAEFESVNSRIRRSGTWLEVQTRDTLLHKRKLIRANKTNELRARVRGHSNIELFRGPDQRVVQCGMLDTEALDIRKRMSEIGHVNIDVRHDISDGHGGIVRQVI